MKAIIICTICTLTFLCFSVVDNNCAYADQTWSIADSNTVWEYYDEEKDPVESGERTLWTQDTFDVSEWKTNEGYEAKFGAKKGVLKEVDSHMPAVLLNQYKEGTTENIEAFFFRTDFNIEEVPDDYVITGTIHYDDAALIYLNGELAVEFDNKQKSDSSLGFTENMQYGGHGSSVKEMQFQIEGELLKEGTNTIAVEIHQVSKSSSDIYFEMESLTLEPFVPQQKSIALNVGADESCRNITWYYNGNEAGEVHYAKRNGDVFPDKYMVARASAETTNYGYLYSNKAVMTGLEPDEEYVYRLVNDGFESEIYTFKTSPENDFSFLAVGDPQLGNKAVASGAKEWKNTLKKSMETFPESAFLLSAGDQVDKASNEQHYDALLENEYLKSLPLATSIGNHDEDSPAYSQHFNNPNVCGYGDSEAGSSYWFTYNDVLFMNMNSNSGSISEHKAFLKAAISANPGAEWKIVTFHHSIYSAANHAEDSGILKRRESYVPMFEELGIDVVFMGHDHVYVRTHIMKELTPVEKDKNEHFAVDPDGILYMTMNSSSGSKMYNVKGDYSYSAVQMQEQIPNVTNVEVTDDALKITVHRVNDKMSVADYFVLYNEKMIPQLIPEEKIDLAYTRCIYNGTYRKPKVTIEGLTRDDYNVTYSDNMYPGKGTVTIKGKGQYKGTITKNFTIRPEATASVTAKLYGYDDIKAVWKSVEGADGYRIYTKKGSGSWKYYSTVKDEKYVNIKNLTDGSSYRVKVVPYVEIDKSKLNGAEKISSPVITLKKVKTKSFKKVDSKVSVRWYNISGESGYQIARAVTKNGKYSVIKTVKTTKGTYYRVKTERNKTYYYKVRAYKQVGDKKICGPWSESVKYKR